MGSIYQIILRLSPALPYVLTGIILFSLSILTVLFFVFRSARKKAPTEGAADEIAPGKGLVAEVIGKAVPGSEVSFPI